MTCTIFKNIFSKEPHWINVDDALNRIKNGASKPRVDEIRQQIGKERADKLKLNLPSVCFSGRFSAERKDDCLLEHSGFMVLDFDEVGDLREKQTDIISKDFVYGCWISPRGNGIKALVKIADGSKHREHFQALQEIFKDIDRSGVNPSRVCFESYDPEIYINTEAKAFTKIKKIEKIEATEVLENEQHIFDRILKWLSNRGDAFVTGERNTFIFKLGSACCRFGISEDPCFNLTCANIISNENSFSRAECQRAIKSAYKASRSKFGSANFEKEILVDKITRKEIKIDDAIFDSEIRAKDVVFGEDVKREALNIYDKGYVHIDGIGVPELDAIFKDKRGEITLLSGIGNYGKTTFWKWRMLMRILKFKNKFAIFGPEDNPAEEFYHDFVEILLGADCTPQNLYRPNKEIYERAYDFVSKHIFYVYPKDMAPTPEYIKERFLELIIKQNIDGGCIDPFNQLSNDYGSAGGRSDKYLETFISDYSRFAQINNIFLSIIAHPKLMKKDGTGSYPCPDVFDLADGAMWNNKMDNILIYHRPDHQTDPKSAKCELHSKKIRRQKTVGLKGSVEFELSRPKRRFFFNGTDPLQKALEVAKLDFEYRQNEIPFRHWEPTLDKDDDLFEV